MSSRWTDYRTAPPAHRPCWFRPLSRVGLFDFTRVGGVHHVTPSALPLARRPEAAPRRRYCSARFAPPRDQGRTVQMRRDGEDRPGPKGHSRLATFTSHLQAVSCKPLLRLSKNPEFPKPGTHKPFIFKGRPLRKNQRLGFFDSLVGQALAPSEALAPLPSSLLPQPSARPPPRHVPCLSSTTLGGVPGFPLLHCRDAPARHACRRTTRLDSFSTPHGEAQRSTVLEPLGDLGETPAATRLRHTLAGVRAPAH
jgi:hypothetical protein